MVRENLAKYASVWTGVGFTEHSYQILNIFTFTFTLPLTQETVDSWHQKLLFDGFYHFQKQYDILH